MKQWRKEHIEIQIRTGAHKASAQFYWQPTPKLHFPEYAEVQLNS